MKKTIEFFTQQMYVPNVEWTKIISKCLEEAKHTEEELVRLRRIVESAELLLLDGITNTMPVEEHEDGSVTVLNMNDDGDYLYIEKQYRDKLHALIDEYLAFLAQPKTGDE